MTFLDLFISKCAFIRTILDAQRYRSFVPGNVRSFVDANQGCLSAITNPLLPHGVQYLLKLDVSSEE